MTQKYDLDSLIETFQDHVKRNEEQRKIDLINFPDAEWLKDDFCISKAILSICEILKDQCKEGLHNDKYTLSNVQDMGPVAQLMRDTETDICNQMLDLSCKAGLHKG